MSGWTNKIATHYFQPVFLLLRIPEDVVLLRELTFSIDKVHCGLLFHLSLFVNWWITINHSSRLNPHPCTVNSIHNNALNFHPFIHQKVHLLCVAFVLSLVSSYKNRRSDLFSFYLFTTNANCAWLSPEIFIFRIFFFIPRCCWGFLTAIIWSLWAAEAVNFTKWRNAGWTKCVFLA